MGRRMSTETNFGFGVLNFKFLVLSRPDLRHLILVALTLDPSPIRWTREIKGERKTEGIGMRTCRRERNPILCSSERTIFSGIVSLPRMRLMFQERRSLVSRSLFTQNFYRSELETKSFRRICCTTLSRAGRRWRNGLHANSTLSAPQGQGDLFQKLDGDGRCRDRREDLAARTFSTRMDKRRAQRWASAVFLV